MKKAYSKIATNSNSSCCQCGCGTLDEQTVKKLSKSIGYSEEEMNAVPEANLGLGCGNPTAFSNIKEGDTVLDLGSGAGFACYFCCDPSSSKTWVNRVPQYAAILFSSYFEVNEFSEADNIDRLLNS